MEKWVLVNCETATRDKTARLIQYSSRLMWGLLENTNDLSSRADYFKSLEYILSSFRKLLRFGKCLDVFYSCLKTIHYPDLTLRLTITFSRLSQAIFLFGDHMIWLSRSGLAKKVNVQKWNNICNKYWLLSIIMNLVRDVYEIYRILESYVFHSRNRNAIRFKQLNNVILETYATMNAHRDIVMDTVKNLCDIFIPLTSLGYTKLSARTVGLLGMMSSFASLLSILNTRYKLLPAA